MRLFIAIDLNDSRDFLLAAQQPLKDAHLSCPSVFHLTLKFIGDKDDPTEIADALAKIRFPAFSLTLEGMGCFPNARSPRVVWIGVAHNKVLMDLQREIDRSLSGIVPMEKSYVPHVTLARVRNESIDIPPLVERGTKKLEVQVRSFLLMESDLSGGRPVYTVVRAFPGVDF